MKPGSAMGWCAAAGVLIACSGSENRLGGKEANTSFTTGTGGSVHAVVETGGAAPDGGPFTGSGGTSGTGDYPPGFGEPNAPHTFAAGKWQGYIENYANSGHSDTITLEFDSLSASDVSGKAVFGDANATPPDFSDPRPYFHSGFAGAPNNDVPAESYPFTVTSGTLTGARLQFTVLDDEIWQPWCVQQTPIADPFDEGQYRCIQRSQDGATSQDAKGCHLGELNGPLIDCARLALCETGPCMCDATACSIQPRAQAHFDVNVQGDHMDGSIAGLSGGALNVHLTKE